MDQDLNKLITWLFNNSGPIIRYRTVKELMAIGDKDTATLLRSLEAG